MTRNAVPARKRRLPPAALRPVLLTLCALAAAWAFLRFQGEISGALARGIGGDTAVALLRAETGRDFKLSRENLLVLGSPLLANVKPYNSGEKETLFARPEPRESVPAPVRPPVMTPLLPAEEDHSPAGELPSPAPERDDEGWDDRVWPEPNEGDPEARPLHEVTLLPVGSDGEYLTDGSAAVNNDTQYAVDLPALLKQPSKLKKSDGPQILIIHTHGSESFLPDERDFYIPDDIERTLDTRYNVVKLGDEIAARLEALGLTVVHDRDIHDFPSYSGSYGRALTRIKEYIEKYPGIQVVLDIHRDSISQKDGTMLKAVCETEYGKTAQMMFVCGSGGTGLQHDGWRDNLSFAAGLQERLLERCPTLMRPIHLRRERFNQHVTPGSLILEIGTAGNSLTEALRAANLFCDATGEYLAGLLLP